MVFLDDLLSWEQFAVTISENLCCSSYRSTNFCTLFITCYAKLTIYSILRTYPTKFIGCCLANPAEDGSGVQQLENLILKVFTRSLAIRLAVLSNRNRILSQNFYLCYRMVIALFGLIQICGLLVKRYI